MEVGTVEASLCVLRKLKLVTNNLLEVTEPVGMRVSIQPSLAEADREVHFGVLLYTVEIQLPAQMNRRWLLGLLHGEK